MGNWTEIEQTVSDDILLTWFITRIGTHGGRVRFPIYIDKDYWDRPITDLLLDTRSLNCLLRMNIQTIRDVLFLIGSGTRIKKEQLKYAGEKSQARIMQGIFLYQYSMLDTNVEKIAYRQKLLEMNEEEE